MASAKADIRRAGAADRYFVDERMLRGGHHGVLAVWLEEFPGVVVHVNAPNPDRGDIDIAILGDSLSEEDQC